MASVLMRIRRDAACPALVVELKWDRSARGALDQIRNKEYASWVQEYTGDILLVGINYKKKEKIHECIIEKYVKQ